MKNKIIIPLDVDTEEKAVELVTKLKDHVGAFKVGLELINTVGFGIFDKIKAAGAKKIFYDCKFCDIPNTVKGASLGATTNGVWMFNVHALGGFDMMKAAKDAAVAKSQELDIPTPLVIAVTILTSINNEVLNSIGVVKDVKEEVASLAKLAKSAGMDGVVCSPHEISIIREACGEDFVIVTPGVRPKGSAIGDQKRVMTPLEAVNAGSDYIVVGRPITKAEDPIKAANNLFIE